MFGLPTMFEMAGAFFAAAIKGIIARVLLAVGLGVVSYTGVSFVINQAVATLHSQMGGIPSDITQLLGLAGFDVFLSLVVSAKFGLITFFMAHRGYSRITFLKGE